MEPYASCLKYHGSDNLRLISIKGLQSEDACFCFSTWYEKTSGYEKMASFTVGQVIRCRDAKTTKFSFAAVAWEAGKPLVMEEVEG
ncbi:Alcohol dehydrogenase 1-like protein [Drosera capensis]